MTPATPFNKFCKTSKNIHDGLTVKHVRTYMMALPFTWAISVPPSSGFCPPRRGNIEAMIRSWLNMAGYKSNSRYPVDKYVTSDSLKLGRVGRGSYLIMLDKKKHPCSHMVQCGITYTTLFNKFHITSKNFAYGITVCHDHKCGSHIPHKMFCLTSQNKIECTTLVPTNLLLFCEGQHFLRPDEAILQTWQMLVFQTVKFFS